MNRGDKQRILFAVFMLCAFLAWITFRLCQLHLGNYSGKIESRNFQQELVALRGTIYDCNGTQNPLAISLPGRLVFIDPKMVNPSHDKLVIAEQLAKALNLNIETILRDLNRTDSRFIRLAVSTDDAVFNLIADKKTMSGVGAQPQTIRSYPQGRRMAHVVGFINAEAIGSAGIEQSRHADMIGAPGVISGEVNANRVEIFGRRTQNIPPVHGASVHLTLDNNIQYFVERGLREAMETSGADAAWAVVQRVATGEILAMVSLPDYDPNQYNRENELVKRNAALGVNFEPGSTMKSMVVAAALNERIITPATVIDAETGIWFYAGKILNDHVRGLVDVTTVIKKSSNIGAAKIGLMLGNKRLEAYLRGFGFGRKLGIDLPGEENGILAPSKKWSMISPTRLSIGQGVAVTAVQMLNAYCTIANGGHLMQPFVVKQVVSSSGETLYEGKPRMIGRPIRPETAATMRHLLTGVTELGGTARRAAVENYTIAGKTGTAQMSVPGGYSSTDYWASFVGFCPAETPEFGMIIVIQRPRQIHTGGAVAAPAFGRIAEEIAHYLEIPADNLAVP